MEKTTDLDGLPPQSSPKRLLQTFLRTFFKLLYHQFAWAYDGVAAIVSLGAWQKWVGTLLPKLAGPRTLEIGFGTGHLLFGICQKGIIPFGLDESPQMVRITSRRLKTNRLDANLVRGNAQALPFADGCIHQVVMTFPAEFVLQTASIHEIYRVLMGQGVALVLPLAWVTGRKPWERLVAWVTRITGEAPEWDENALEPWKKFGFEVSWEMINLPSSKVLLIRLLKPRK